jgi:hypothetical protein
VKELVEGDRSIPLLHLEIDKARSFLNCGKQFIRVEMTIMGIAYLCLELKEELLRLPSSLFRCRPWIIDWLLDKHEIGRGTDHFPQCLRPSCDVVKCISFKDQGERVIRKAEGSSIHTEKPDSRGEGDFLPTRFKWSNVGGNNSVTEARQRACEMTAAAAPDLQQGCGAKGTDCFFEMRY